MKKLLLILFISLGFIGPVYAAKNAGLALTYGFGSVAIAAGLGFVLFILIKPKKDTEEKKAVYYGRLFLAYIIWASTVAVFPQFLILPNIDSFLRWLIGSIIFGSIAYVIGSVYGASKKTAGKLAKKTKTIAKTAIEKSVEKPIKKTVEKPQELATEKNITKNENTMDEENSDEINDEEFYLIATKEVEDGDIDSALWAKCMAINMGDEKKSKYEYINRRVSSLIIKAKEKKIADDKAAEEKKIADDKAAEEKKIADAEKAATAAAEKKKLDDELWDDLGALKSGQDMVPAIKKAMKRLNIKEADLSKTQIRMVHDKANKAYKKGHLEIAFTAFTFLADKGDVFAQTKLGLMYERAEGTSKDYTKAIYWYKKAANQGYLSAKKNLDALELNLKKEES